MTMPRTFFRARRPTVAPAALALLLAAAPLPADTQVELGVRVEHSDNIDRVEDNPRSDVLRAPYVGVSWQRDSPAWNARIDGELSYVDFRDDESSDDTFGEVGAEAWFHLIEDRLDFQVENRFQQTRIDEFGPRTPANSADANAFIMGPDLHFAPSRVDRLTFSARYGDTYFERDTDSERWVGGATWEHRLDPLNALALHVEHQELEFTETDVNAIDYDKDEVGVGWTHRLARGELGLTVGGQRIDKDDGATLERGFGRLDLEWNPGRRTELDLSAQSGLTDAGVRLLGRNNPTVELPDADAFVSNDIVTLSQIQARLLRRGAKLDVSLGVRASDEDFERRELDRELIGATVGLQYALTPVDSLEWTLGAARTDYDLIERRDDDLLTALWWRHRLGRHLFVELGVDHQDRDSSRDGSSYDETRSFLAAGYRWGD